MAPQWHSRAIVTGTLFGVLYTYQVRVSSVALHSLKAAYARIPAAIDETARTLGVSRWRLLTRCTRRSSNEQHWQPCCWYSST